MAQLEAGTTTTLTGDVTGSGTTSIAATLATVNANVGSFTRASITVDAKGRITAASNGTGIGDVVGPSSATDNAITRFDTTTGKLIQNSSATLDDSGNMTAATHTVTGSTVPANGVYRPSANVLGLAANTHSHVRIYDVDANGDAYIGLSGGGNDGSKGRVRVLAASDTWDNVTMRVEAKGPIGQVHFYQNGICEFMGQMDRQQAEIQALQDVENIIKRRKNK